MKRKSILKKFKTTREMDAYLENSDLGSIFKAKGVVIRPTLKKINLDLPPAMIQQIDSVAAKIGISRQPLLKLWIHERLGKENILKWR